MTMNNSLPLPRFESRRLGLSTIFIYSLFGIVILFLVWGAYTSFYDSLVRGSNSIPGSLKTFLCASVLILIASFLVAMQYGRKKLETKLVTHGAIVRATIISSRITGADEESERYLEYKFVIENGCSYTGEIQDNDDFFHEGNEIDVIHDPSSPYVNYGINELKFYQPSLDITPK